MKLFVAAVDAFDPDLYNKFADELPTLSMLADAGAEGTVVGPSVFTPEVWTTFATGCLPETHGVQQHYKEELGEAWSREHVNVPPLWKILARRTDRIGIIEMPVVGGPPEEARNDIVFEGGPEPLILYRTQVWPPEVGESLDDFFSFCQQTGPLRFSEEPSLDVLTNQIAQRADDGLKRSSLRWDGLRPTISNMDVNHLFYWQACTDRIGHYAIGLPDIMLKTYKFIDNWIGEVIDIFEPEMVVVLGDHGMVHCSDERAVLGPSVNGTPIDVEGTTFWRTSGPKGSRYLTGSHQRLSKLIMWGRGIRNVQGLDMLMEDVMPTILAGMGLSCGDFSIDGSVHYPALGAHSSYDEERDIVAELRDLGYI